ncbi:MAG: helix-hairpin-helix domain-containing protein [Armatimonadetes bacterium]|nr:helix-hairpin-helix domain-containing protein [Armatimonadota bacterium]
MQRGVFIALALMLLGGIGFGLRKNAQPPPVTFLSGSAYARNAPRQTPSTRPRIGGASPARTPPASTLLVVHVAGAVKKPGVYALAPGKRVIDAVNKAGGAARSADLDSLNLAARIGDGQQIFIPAKGSGTGPSSPSRRSAAKSVKTASGMVNVNTATLEELDRLPGVGPSTAQKIMEYRDSHGPFTSPEGLLEVKGIGPKKLEKMRPYLLLQ